MLTRAFEGFKHLFEHEPLRLIAIASTALALIYDQLDAGIAPENVAIAVAALLLTELGRAVVTSPATADPNHTD